MHITQTYLGTYGESGLFVYYLFEDYNDEQQRLTERVQNALDDLGADYMEDIDLFRPNERFAGQIAREVRDIPAVTRYCHGELPGFLVSKTPLVEVDPSDGELVFFSIKGRSEDEALQVVDRIRQLTRDTVYSARQENVEVQRKNGVVVRFWDALEIKPGFMGIGIDLKSLFRRQH